MESRLEPCLVNGQKNCMSLEVAVTVERGQFIRAHLVRLACVAVTMINLRESLIAEPDLLGSPKRSQNRSRH